MKKLLSLFLCSCSLAGCVTSAAPNLISGHYYMAGDAECKHYRQADDSHIECLDSDESFTGYRSAMTATDMQTYSYQQQVQAQQIQSLNSQLQDTNAQLSAQNAYLLNSTRQYTAPAPTTIPQQHSNTTCLVAGMYINCRN